MKENKITKWTSYILQGLISVMFLMSAGMNLAGSETAVSGAVEMGYPESIILFFGITQLVIIILYLFPKTSFIGAILLTGWLGGAVATHIIHGDPTGQTFFPVLIGIIAWVAIGLRSERIKNLVGF